jgi:hypothetical protein
MDLIGSIKKRTNDLTHSHLIYYVFPVLLIAILYYSVFSSPSAYIGEWHDIISNSLQYTQFETNLFSQWNNLWSGGFPTTASPGSDKYYILTFPFYLVFHDLTIVNIVILLHILIAYFAFFKLGSLVCKNYDLLTIFSLIFAFSGMILARIDTGHHLILYGLVWIPLLFYFFLKIMVFDRPTILNVIGLSVVSMLVYFTGNIYHFVFAYLIILVFFLYYVVQGKVSRKILVFLFLSVLLTTLLAAIKAVPDLIVSNSLVRIDPINPFEGGGSIGTDLAAFIFGTATSPRFSVEETCILIGVLPLLLMILAWVYGKREIAIPSFFAMLFAMIWSDGGNNLLSFIHLFPIVSGFRVPGRIFGALLPIVLLMALYGAWIVFNKLKSGESFLLSQDQRRSVRIGVGLVALVFFCELPYFSLPSSESIISVILIGAFILLLYLQKATIKNLLYFFIFALALNLLILVMLNAATITDDVIKLLIIGGLLFAFFFITRRKYQKNPHCHAFYCLLVLGIFVMMAGSISFVNTYTPPFDNSPAIDVISAINKSGSENPQVWVYENGWAFQHMDFTYWDVMNGLHPASLYLPYYLDTAIPVAIGIGNVTYYTSDYLVDTAYLENGNENLPEVTFKVNNISVFKPDHVLPNAFVVRNEQLIPATIEKFTPDEVTLSGQFRTGDVAGLKTSYYPGWMMNGQDTSNSGNLVSVRIPSETSSVTFRYDPLDVKFGALLSGIGLLLVIVIIMKRRNIELYLDKTGRTPVQDSERKKKKR